MLRHKARPWSGSVANRDVDVLALEVRDRVARADVYIDVRMRGEKSAYLGQQPPGGEGRHDADSQLSRVRALAHLAHRVAQIRKYRAHATRKTLPFVGQPDPASGALDESNAKIRLERLDLMADCAVRQMKRFGGAGEALGTRGGLEGAQRLHRWKAIGHCVPEDN